METQWDEIDWEDESGIIAHHKARRIRKGIRHSIRCINRTMFSHGMYEPILEIGGEYFD